jgi:polyphenol oxidase
MFFLEKNDSGVFRVKHPFGGLEIGVIAKSANTVDYTKGSAEVRRQEKELLSGVTGTEALGILALDQEHGDSILIIREPPVEEKLIHGVADGLITGLPGICLVIRTADCVPVYVYDPVRRILGAAHSGWRGTRLDIARKLVREMAGVTGSAYRDLHAYILPSIGPGSYNVGKDVADLFPRDIGKKNGMLYLDLWGNIERSLVEEGVPPGNIFCARICTLGSNEEFFSYRAGDSGRNLNFGVMKF